MLNVLVWYKFPRMRMKATNHLNCTIPVLNGRMNGLQVRMDPETWMGRSTGRNFITSWKHCLIYILAWPRMRGIYWNYIQSKLLLEFHIIYHELIPRHILTYTLNRNKYVSIILYKENDKYKELCNGCMSICESNGCLSAGNVSQWWFRHNTSLGWVRLIWTLVTSGLGKHWEQGNS